MDESRLRDGLKRLAEGADHSDPSAPAIVEKARRRIMRNVVVGALVGIIVTAGVVFAGTQLTGRDDLPPVDQDENERYGLLEPARDGDISFEVFLAQCFERDGERSCHLELHVTNEGTEEVGPLDPSWQLLRFADGTVLLPDEDEMRRYGREFSTNRTAFNLPLPPAESLPPAALIYEGVQQDALPVELELHGSEDSDGVLIELRECDFTNSCSTPGPHPSIGEREVTGRCGSDEPMEGAAVSEQEAIYIAFPDREGMPCDRFITELIDDVWSVTLLPKREDGCTHELRVDAQTGELLDGSGGCP